MHRSLLTWLRCSYCLSRLRLDADAGEGDVSSGRLLCDCGQGFPIVRGVPRMHLTAWQEHDAKPVAPSPSDQAEEPVRKAFEAQWKAWGNHERIFGRTMDDMKRHLADEICGPQLPLSALKDRLVLEAGFGHARYLEWVAEAGAVAIGLELSGHAVDAAQARLGGRANVHLIQGDILHPPFERRQFDFIFSRGVLMLTSNTRLAFHLLAERVKSSGFFSVWVYPVRGWWFEWTTRWLRFFTTRMPLGMLRLFCLFPIAWLTGFRRDNYASRQQCTLSERAQIAFDFLSQPYQTRHRPAEVAGWFREEGFDDAQFIGRPVGAIGRCR